MQAPHRQHDLQTMMRRFGRQCRGRGHVCVTLVRHTETHLVARGRHVLPLTRAVQERLHRLPQRAAVQRGRLDRPLTAALAAQARIAPPSRRLTPGHAWPHVHIVHADDPTSAPMGTGNSHGPAPFGRKPGRIAEPAAGFIVAVHRPVGHPRDVTSVEPLVDHVQHALTRVTTRPTLAIHALAGDLALTDAAWREARHAPGMLTMGSPTTVEPLPPSPTPEEVLRILDEADLHGRRTPAPV